MTPSSRSQARDRRVLGGIFTGVAGRGLGLIAPFLVMPAMLDHLGQVNFGIWMTTVSITSMAMFMDFGIGNGLLTKLSKAFGEQDHPTSRTLIATGYAALTLIALVAGTLLLLTLTWLEVRGQVGMWRTTDGSAMQIVIVTGFAFLIGIPVSVIQKVMLACQQPVRSNAWQIAGSIMAVVCCYCAIRAGLPAGVAVAAYSLPPILVMLLATGAFFNSYPALQPRRHDFSMAHAKELMALGSYFFALSIITSIALNSDNVIIAFVLGPEKVTEYAVPAKLASVLALLVTTMFLPLWAANGEAIARRDYPWVQRTALRMSVIGGLVIGSLGLLLALLNEQIMTVWMGRVFAHGTDIVAGFALMYTLFAVASPHNMILNGAGMVRVQIQAWGAYFLLSIGLKFIYLWEIQRADALPYLGALTYLLAVLPATYFAARKVYRA